MRVALLSLVVSFAAACGGGITRSNLSATTSCRLRRLHDRVRSNARRAEHVPRRLSLHARRHVRRALHAGRRRMRRRLSLHDRRPVRRRRRVHRPRVQRRRLRRAWACPTTSISGTVFAPNGTLPLYGVTVYVPNADPRPAARRRAVLRAAATCCPATRSSQTTTDEAGHFTLTGVPAGANIPLVIRAASGAARSRSRTSRQCTRQRAAGATDTRLPKNQQRRRHPEDRDLHRQRRRARVSRSASWASTTPRSAPSGGAQRIHLYTDATRQRRRELVQGWLPWRHRQLRGLGDQLWNDVNNLKPYDIVILSCEGEQYPEHEAAGGAWTR